MDGMRVVGLAGADAVVCVCWAWLSGWRGGWWLVGVGLWRACLACTDMMLLLLPYPGECIAGDRQRVRFRPLLLLLLRLRHSSVQAI